MPECLEPALSVTVVRTGGIAGLRRTWRAAPAGDDAERWLELIDRCPWNDGSHDPSGADRFCWRVSAETGREHHEAELPDADVTGPWRTLIDAVRAWPDVTLPAGDR
ncbi:hypothetical protein QNO21_03350 [Microbacterium sp. zg-Y818]|uniref:protealysin inhibitor emfourin n=1 Tax=unclassified Microbacterium TaxID=2609290 RepID=UPI00214C53F6|nr:MULTISPECIES: protealysin inhibitor emfourin [unclassified Microbacterium]MCR2801641.1 hypothetical protein [Microbacterium sp. zg.Y818]WIM23087.1 hypothetical protein QNO21_03350 [Microbacterium sp. zg-Y818]